ncbi:hypothetical protein [Flavobacterium psychrophilum]|uniref:hypothetical protein n=1 Tax=Flavobacterium psychrophilum TaxID=96345 RepID=UPI0029138882|nr:hypothetical protein [Flavobacterium psychrophilum]
MKKIILGDIFEISTPKGYAYLHYVCEDVKIGRTLLRVLQGLYLERPNNLEELSSQKERYLLFFPLKEAYKRGIVERVGFLQCDSFVKPQKMRSEHNVKGEFLGWHIIDTDTWHRDLVKNLNPEQQKLSDWGSWNDTLLIENLINNWSLESW